MRWDGIGKAGVRSQKYKVSVKGQLEHFSSVRRCKGALCVGMACGFVRMNGTLLASGRGTVG